MTTQPPICQAASAPNVYQAALAYEALGFSILPCLGKKPAIAWAQLQKRRATRAMITAWHEAGLLQNVGIICGSTNNLAVIDLDGDQAITTFNITWPSYSDTYTIASGSGHGLHLYFFYPVEAKPHTTRVIGSEVGNIELRIDGCYVIAPPSIHPSGKPYMVANTHEIMFLPSLHLLEEWIKRLIRKKNGGQMPPPANPMIFNGTAYGQAALRGEADKVRQASKGERNLKLFEAALRMGSLIRDRKIGAPEVERVLTEAARGLTESDGEAATLRTIRSGLQRGLENSRDQHKHA